MIARRAFIHQSLAATATTIGAPSARLCAEELAKNKNTAIEIGSHRELLVDDYLIASMDGVQLNLHKPEARDVVIVCDKPWEGNTSAYYTLFREHGGDGR